MNQTTQCNKHKVYYTDSDRAKSMLTELIDHYMRTKHADVIEQMKQFITDQFHAFPDEQSDD